MGNILFITMLNQDKSEINAADLFFEFESGRNFNKGINRSIKKDHDLDLLSKIYKHGKSEQRLINNITKYNIRFNKIKLDDLRLMSISRTLKTLNILNSFFEALFL